MADLQRLRKRFSVAITVLAVVDLVLLVYLFWPGSSASGQKAQEAALQQQYRSLSHDVSPLRGIDQKLVQTRADIKTLYKERIPSHWSVISQEVEKLALQTGVSSQAIHYVAEKSEKGDLPDVQRIEIDTSITGEYSEVARFINALEQDKLLFVITQVALSGQEAGQVTLQIKFETFLKEASSANGT